MSHAVLRKEYKNRDVIFEEGLPSPGLFLLHRGTVAIQKAISPGVHKDIATLKPPTFFGEMSLVTDLATSARAMAEEPSICFILSKPEFDRLMATESLSAYKTAAAIAQMLARRLRAMDEEVVKILADQPLRKQEQFARFKNRMLTEFNY